MLDADIFILQLRHLFLGLIQGIAKVRAKALARVSAADFRPATQLVFELVFDGVYRRVKFLKQRPS